MTRTIAGVFLQADDAQRAVAALLDNGVASDNVSVATPTALSEPPPAPAADDFMEVEVDDIPTPSDMNTYTEARRGGVEEGVLAVEAEAKSGITTTTSADAARGAAEGGAIGLGLGILFGAAALTIPGVGPILAAGPLWAAIGGAVATSAAGAVAGGAVGYLEDQGVHTQEAHHYVNALTEGSTVVSVQVPETDDVDTVQQVLVKYGGSLLSEL